MTRKNPFSFVVMLCLAVLFLVKGIVQPGKQPLAWDVYGYYLYLPQTFIYNDLGMEDRGQVRDLQKQYKVSTSFYQAYQTKTGKLVIKYPMGMAMTYAPFFLGAHAVAQLTDHPADGFSKPYQYGLVLSSLFFTLMGLWVLRIFLLRYLQDKTVALLLLLICLGTNLFSQALFSFGMPHMHLFGLYALLLLVTDNWHKKATRKNTIGLGLLLGLIMLCRPTEIVACLLPLLWGVTSWTSFKQKLHLLFVQERRKLILLVFTVLFMGSFQFLYWKYITGDFIHYSYANNPGEGLDLFSPHVWNSLFSYRKGWLLYTPLMLLVFFGVWQLKRKANNWFVGILFFLVFNVYLVSAWSCWWYADSFGLRAYVQSYAVLALPLGVFLEGVAWRRVSGLFLVLFLTGCTVLNVFQTWQMSEGILHPQRMSKAYYWATFGRTEPVTWEMKKLLLLDRTTPFEHMQRHRNYTAELAYRNGFETEHRFRTEPTHRGWHAVELSKDRRFSPAFFEPYESLTDKDHLWVEASAWVYFTEPVEKQKLTFMISMQHKQKEYAYGGIDFEKEEDVWEPGKWHEIRLLYLTPEVRSGKDRVKVYFWLRGSGKVYMDDLEVILHQPE